MKESRYYVQSEKYPGEPRVYWVVDSTIARPTIAGYAALFSSNYYNKVGELTESRGEANRLCRKLNKEQAK